MEVCYNGNWYQDGMDLRLDADYQLSASLIAELAQLNPDADISAYQVDFDYAIFSIRLTASLYPPKTIILRQGRFSVEDKGHTETWIVKGRTAKVDARVVHDDWKRTDRWIAEQVRYMRRELNQLRVTDLGWASWLRCRPPLMPMAVFLYCLFGKRLILNGRAGLFYALQRMVAEAILALMVLEERLRERAN